MQLSPTDIWQTILERIEPQCDPTAYNMWLRRSRALRFDGKRLIVAFSDEFARDWLQFRYAKLVQIALRDLNGEESEVEFVVNAPTPNASANGRSASAQPKWETNVRPHLPGLTAPDSGNVPARSSKATPKGIASRLAKSARGTKAQLDQRAESDEPRAEVIGVLNPRYVFDTFVVGSSNRFAHAASLAVAESPASVYNPFFIYGGVGLGKTHLMQAIGQYAAKAAPNARICYVTSETFTNELIWAIQNKSQAAFRNKYRTVDLLLIDDVQFVAGRESTQEEFFHTFNTLYEADRQIVMTSDRPPKDILTLEERLRSRFESGLQADIQAPDFETRMAILREKSLAEGVEMPSEVLEEIATHIQSNIRELEGALVRVYAYAELHGRTINLELVHYVLKDTFSAHRLAPVTIARIQEVVAEHFGIRSADMKARKRTKAIAFPRQVAMYLAREMTDASLPKIGEEFGGRDHSTVVHAHNKVQSDVQEDPALHAAVRELTERLKAGK